LTSVPAWRAMRLVSCALEDQGCSSAKAGVSAPALRDTGIITWTGEAMKAPGIALTGVFEYGSGRIGRLAISRGRSPFAFQRLSRRFARRPCHPALWGVSGSVKSLVTRPPLADSGDVGRRAPFQPAAPSGYSDSSPPNSAPDFMSATLCDRMFRGRRELVRCRVVKQKPGTKTLGY
jgi:hypothetical protein